MFTHRQCHDINPTRNMNAAPYRVSPLSDIIFGVVLPRQLMIRWFRGERRFTAKWIQRPSTPCTLLNRLLMPAGYLYHQKLLKTVIVIFRRPG